MWTLERRQTQWRPEVRQRKGASHRQEALDGSPYTACGHRRAAVTDRTCANVMRVRRPLTCPPHLPGQAAGARTARPVSARWATPGRSMTLPKARGTSLAQCLPATGFRPFLRGLPQHPSTVIVPPPPSLSILITECDETTTRQMPYGPGRCVPTKLVRKSLAVPGRRRLIPGHRLTPRAM